MRRGESKSSRAGVYIVAAVLIAAVVAAAGFQEELGYFFQLRMWDQGAPARAVDQFLAAVKKGDQQEASRFLAIEGGARPVEKDGKWVGYSYVAQNLPYEIHLADITPPGDSRAGSPEFILKGRGAATVMAPGKSGEPVKYRLEVVGGDWRITEIGSATRPS